MALNLSASSFTGRLTLLFLNAETGREMRRSLWPGGIYTMTSAIDVGRHLIYLSTLYSRRIGVYDTRSGAMVRMIYLGKLRVLGIVIDTGLHKAIAETTGGLLPLRG
jgi:hypothetical protein